MTQSERQMSLKNDEAVYAMIYPLLRGHINRIFQGKDVFCKYTGQRTFRINSGTKILFYASGSGRQILGEGLVDSREQLTPDELLGKYANRVFISRDELEKYRGERSRDLKLLVLRLRDIRKFDYPKVLSVHMTMTGMQLSKGQYEGLMGNFYSGKREM
jgi:hypothetical protein